MRDARASYIGVSEIKNCSRILCVHYNIPEASLACGHVDLLDYPSEQDCVTVPGSNLVRDISYHN
jgi:hypothetical protein